MQRLSYKLLHIFFEKLKAEDKECKKRVYVSDKQIHYGFAAKMVFEKASDFLIKEFDAGTKDKIYRSEFRKKGRIKVWNELFRKDKYSKNKDHKEKHQISKSEFSKHLAPNKSWVERLHKRYEKNKDSGGDTRYHVCYTIAFYFRCYDLNELEEDIEQNCTELKERFKEDIYKGLFDDLPEAPKKEAEKATKKNNKRKWFNFNTVTRKIFGFVTILLFLGAIIWGGIRFFQNPQKLLYDDIKILVLALEGDHKKSLQIELLRSLEENLDDIANIKIEGSEEKIDYKLAVKNGHEQAREIGEECGADIVVWGEIAAKKDKFYPRITIVYEDVSRFLVDDKGFTLPFVVYNNIELPDILIEKPKLLANFINAYNYYKKGNHKLALSLFKEIESQGSQEEIRNTDLFSFIGFSYLILFARHRNRTDYYSQAVNYFNKIITLLPKDYETCRDLGIIYYLNKKYKKAVKFLEKSIKLGTTNKAEAYEFIGYCYTSLGEAEKGVAFLEKAIKEVPNSYNTMRNLGFEYKKQGNSKKAIEWFKKAISLNPDYDDAWVDMGIVYWEKGNFNKAMDSFDKAININRKNCYAWNGKGVVFDDLEKYDDALNCYQEAINIKPNFYDALINIGNVYADKKEYDKAFVCFENILRMNPFLHQVYDNIGSVYMDMENYREAILFFDFAISGKYPYNAWFNKGICFKKLGEFDKAFSCMIKSIELKPDFYEGWHRIGALLNEIHNYKNAVPYLKQAIKLKPDYQEGWNDLGISFLEQDSLEEAINCFNKAIGINKSDHKCWSNLGLAYDEQGNDRKAIECFQKATTIKPDYLEAWFNIGTHYFFNKNYSLAFKNLSKVVKIKPDFIHAWLYIGSCHFDEKETSLENLAKFSRDYGNMNLGNIYLLNKQKDKAIAYFRLGRDNFFSKEKFWEEFVNNFKFLKAYGLDLKQDQYMKLIDEIGK